MASENESIDAFLDSLQFSNYKTIYVSYGSKNERGRQNSFPQSNPFFLQYLGPYLSIAIDPQFENMEFEDHKDPDFRFATIPLNKMSDQKALELSENDQKEKGGKGRPYIFFKMNHSINQTSKITKKIVKLLNGQRVFFVNFIKFVNPESYDAWVGKYVDIEKNLGPFTKDYYEWGGYLYPSVIIKQHSTISTISVPSLLSSTHSYYGFDKSPSILDRMYNDITNKKSKFNSVVDVEVAQRSLLESVIDITGSSEASFDQNRILSEMAGGKRKRKRTYKRVKLLAFKPHLFSSSRAKSVKE